MAKLRRQAKFFGMTEDEEMAARFYTGSADNEELSDTLREGR